MKLFFKTFLFLFMVLNHQNLFSQSLSLEELIKLNNLNEDDFDTYVTEKGFKYDGFIDQEFSHSKSYAFYIGGLKTSYISKHIYKRYIKEMVSFQTPNSVTYLNIKASIKKLDFQYSGSETFESTTFMNYTKDFIEISLASLTDVSQPNGIVKTVYEISVSKTK